MEINVFLYIVIRYRRKNELGVKVENKLEVG